MTETVIKKLEMILAQILIVIVVIVEIFKKFKLHQGIQINNKKIKFLYQKESPKQ